MKEDSGAAYRLSPLKRRRSPQAIGKVLSLALKRYGIDKDVARYEFVLHWTEIMGEDIAKRTRPESLENSILTVRVCNSEWAQELAFQKEIIKTRLNRFLAESHSQLTVNDVRFWVGDIAKQ